MSPLSPKIRDILIPSIDILTLFIQSYTNAVKGGSNGNYKSATKWHWSFTKSCKLCNRNVSENWNDL